MYFQLTHGVHIDSKNGKTYRTEWERDDKGGLRYTKQPVVESDVNLAEAFGTDKFRRLTEAEAKDLLLADKKASGRTAPTGKSPDVSAETEVSKSAKKGAVGIAEPPGKDVTNRYEGAVDAGLKIYRKAKDQYIVHTAKDDEPLTEDPITKKEVEKLIKDYLE